MSKNWDLLAFGKVTKDPRGAEPSCHKVRLLQNTLSHLHDLHDQYNLPILSSIIPFSTTATAAMANEPALLTALFAVRLAFSVVLLATSLSFLTAKNSTSPSSNSPITSVVVAVTTPRRSLILSILSLVALTYFLDGFGLVLHSVLSKHWQGTPSAGHWWRSQWSGIEVEAVAGLLASGLLAIIGVWKESQGVPVWSMKRPKFWAATAIVGTVVEVALIFSTVDFRARPIGAFRICRITTNILTY